MGPKSEKDIFFSKGLEREARSCQQRGVKRAQHPRRIEWMQKVRNIIWRHAVLIDTLKTETSNFVLNPSLHWKPVGCSEQCCCTSCLDLRGQVRLHDFVWAEVYSVCFQGYQQEENYSSLT